MLRKKTVILVAILTLTACTTLPPGAVPYSSEEIEAALTNRTWSWSNGGGIYYRPDGQATIKFEGKIYQSNWTAESGKFCHSTESENGPYCWALFWQDGQSKSFSLWQPEYSKPYNWDPAKDTRAGNRL